MFEVNVGTPKSMGLKSMMEQAMGKTATGAGPIGGTIGGSTMGKTSL